jgi:DNA-binding NarL/FixJ family response regulator
MSGKERQPGIGEPIVPSGRSATSDGATLSSRELEVARLAAEGKTNREIASTLYLSEKTVETHMSHILAKLDISSRTDIAAKLSSAEKASQA